MIHVDSPRSDARFAMGQGEKSLGLVRVWAAVVAAVLFAVAPSGGQDHRRSDRPKASTPLADVENGHTRSAAAAGSSTFYHYYYFKEQIPMSLRPCQVAIKPAASLGDAELLASYADVLSGGWTALTLSGWMVADVRDTAGSDDISNTVRRLANDARVEFVSPVFETADGGSLIVTPTILVGFEASSSNQQDDVLRHIDTGEVIERDWAGMADVFRVAAASRDGFEVLNAANSLAERSDVRFAEPNFITRGQGGLIPNDPYFSSLWGLHNTGQSGGLVNFDMNAPEAWDVTTGNGAVIVVVLDTGVQPNHPDLHYWGGADFTGEGGAGAPINACDNHGTPVAGCVAAIMNNSLGVVGVAPGCFVASARIGISEAPCSRFWTGENEWTVNALAWAQSIGARVTNNSNDYDAPSSAITQKYLETYNAGLLHFASAGNESASSITYPARLAVVNAVAALSRTGARAGFSNYGNGLDFSAPGEGIGTTDRASADGWLAGDYVWADGTSFASPYAAGVAALVLSLDPSLSPPQVEQIMQQSCRDLGASGYDTSYGWGLVDARAATVAACIDPSIVSGPPNGVIAYVGGTIEVAVSAAGSPVLGHQWRKASQPLADDGHFSGTHTNTLRIEPAVLGDSGLYDVVVSNGCGTVTSSQVQISVFCSLNIVDPVDDQTVPAGATAVFHVGVTGTPPFDYYWMKDTVGLSDGGRISGAHTSTLSIANVNAGDAGEYEVEVLSCAGPAQSRGRLDVVQNSCVEWSYKADFARNLPATTYDGACGRTVLFGNGFGTETWDWDGLTWRLRAPTGPSGRLVSAMAYFPGFGSLLFGGGTASSPWPNDRWKWNCSSWQSLGVGGPSARLGHAMVYDAARAEIVLYGGQEQSTLTKADTWVWRPGAGTGWTRRCDNCQPGPGPRAGHRMAYESGRQMTVLYGGANSRETWGWNGAQWTLLDTDGPPGNRQFAGMAYDERRAVTVLFGGVAGDLRTWEWDGSAWSAATLPGPEWHQGGQNMVFDSARGVAVLLDGQKTWELEPGRLIVTQQPVDAVGDVGETRSFSVVATGSGTLSYRWRKNGSELTNDARISGSTTSMLTITSMIQADTGSYDVVIANHCVEYVSNAATLTVSGPGDLNGDGIVDVSDFVIFADCMAGPGVTSPPPTVTPEQFAGADLDGDGDADLLDFASFQQLFRSL